MTRFSYVPELFPTLRVLIDEPLQDLSWLILGSASAELLHQSSETLAGRVAFLEIHPFSFDEVGDGAELWLRGGVPKSYLAEAIWPVLNGEDNISKLFWNKIYPILALESHP